MTGERSAQRKEICGEALPHREADLAAVGHQAIRDFLETTSSFPATTLSTPARTTQRRPVLDCRYERPSGERLGAYTLERELGRGGMGAVYFASRADGQYEKAVAIKVVRPGLNTQPILERFRHERQILADFEHPHIARLLDGGTTSDGLPYFVMELIDGQPIDVFCDAARLGIAARLRLFLQICDAVSHAHQRLIIHRDIKPANILVTRDGVPKLLDFGIAKVLHGDRSHGRGDDTSGERPMTPAYASPEQVRGELLTTASDVYSLGVLLYELLTGRRPYRVNGRDRYGLAQQIAEARVEAPSSALRPDRWREGEPGPAEIARLRGATPGGLRRALAGDLDTIVLKALRKEPARRYGSVAQLSDDIRRHLEGRPVLARPDRFLYRARKFVQRHQAGVLAGVLVTLLVIGASVAWTAQSRRALADQRDTVQRFTQARDLTNRLFSPSEIVKDGARSDEDRRRVPETVLGYLDTLSQQAAGNVGLLRELAGMYHDVASKQCGSASMLDAGHRVAALQREVAVREELWHLTHDGKDQEELAHSHFGLGLEQRNRGDRDDAVVAFRKALAILEQQQLPTERDSRAYIYVAVGSLLLEREATADALPPLRKGLLLSEDLLREDPGNVQRRRVIAGSHAAIGTALARLGQLVDSEEEYRRALALDGELPSLKPYEREARAQRLERLAKVLKRQGRAREATSTYRNALRIYADLVSSRDSLAPWMALGTRMARIYLELGDRRQALAAARQGLATVPSGNTRQAVAHRLNWGSEFARFCQAMSEHEAGAEAFRLCSAGLEIVRAGAASDATSLERQRVLGGFLVHLSVLATAEGEHHGTGERRTSCDQAAGWSRESLDVWHKLEQSEPLSGDEKRLMASASAILTRCGEARAGNVLNPDQRPLPGQFSGSKSVKSILPKSFGGA